MSNRDVVMYAPCPGATDDEARTLMLDYLLFRRPVVREYRRENSDVASLTTCRRRAPRLDRLGYLEA